MELLLDSYLVQIPWFLTKSYDAKCYDTFTEYDAARYDSSTKYTCSKYGTNALNANSGNESNPNQSRSQITHCA